MAVLVHPNFDNEIANGVALTKNVYFPDFKGFYVNVQVGESLVTNPIRMPYPMSSSSWRTWTKALRETRSTKQSASADRA